MELNASNDVPFQNRADFEVYTNRSFFRVQGQHLPCGDFRSDRLQCQSFQLIVQRGCLGGDNLGCRLYDFAMPKDMKICTDRGVVFSVHRKAGLPPKNSFLYIYIYITYI